MPLRSRLRNTSGGGVPLGGYFVGNDTGANANAQTAALIQQLQAQLQNSANLSAAQIQALRSSILELTAKLAQQTGGAAVGSAPAGSPATGLIGLGGTVKSNDGKTLVVTGRDGKDYSFDAKTGQPLASGTSGTSGTGAAPTSRVGTTVTSKSASGQTVTGTIIAEDGKGGVTVRWADGKQAQYGADGSFVPGSDTAAGGGGTTTGGGTTAGGTGDGAGTVPGVTSLPATSTEGGLTYDDWVAQQIAAGNDPGGTQPIGPVPPPVPGATGPAGPEPAPTGVFGQPAQNTGSLTGATPTPMPTPTIYPGPVGATGDLGPAGPMPMLAPPTTYPTPSPSPVDATGAAVGSLGPAGPDTTPYYPPPMPTIYQPPTVYPGPAGVTGNLGPAGPTTMLAPPTTYPGEPTWNAYDPYAYDIPPDPSYLPPPMPTYGSSGPY